MVALLEIFVALLLGILLYFMLFGVGAWIAIVNNRKDKL